MPRSQTNLHHANLLIGGLEEAEVYLSSLCDELGFKRAHNPDFFAFRIETFGIDEARQLRLLALRKAIGEYKIFFIAPAQITREAQNALLKTFEDPTPRTHFFLVVSEDSQLEPTLLSRMQSLRLSRDSLNQAKSAKNFLTLPIKDRLLFAKKFVDDELNVINFLDSLLSLVRESGDKNAVEKIFNIRRLVREDLPSPRLVLEHLSLVL